VLSVGIDMGGTFTDGYVTDGLRATVCKVPTTHFDLSRSVVGCLRRGAEWFELDFEKFLGDVDVLRVATTIGTNAVVEGTGDTLALIVEQGAERTLYGAVEPAPAVGVFVDQEHVRGVEVDGEVEDLLRHCRELVGLGVRRVVVSFRGSHHSAEARLRELVATRYPEHYLRSIPLSIGSEVSNVDDDQVRTNTALLNAYLSRPMAKLLYGTEGLLQQSGLRVPLLAVRSDAGCARVARTTAIATFGSGPAAGLALVVGLARQYGDQVALGFDMGGTTLDLGLVRDGVSEVEDTPEIRGVRVALPVPGVVSVGLGGCSVAEVRDGVTTVGPASVGAIPGPACFGRGGTAPALTDADLVLGFLGVGDRFGDEIELVDGPARTALESASGGPAEMAARAVREAAQRKAADAIGALLADAGVDPARVCLYAYGGAGALHACGVADLLGINRIRSFPFGSVFSARGVAGADLHQELTARVDGDDPIGTVARLVRRASIDLDAEMLDPAAARLVMTLDGVDGTRCLQGSADDVVAGAGRASAHDRSGWTRVRLSTVVGAPPTPPITVDEQAEAGSRDVWWRSMPVVTPLLGVGAFAAGAVVTGPALVRLAGVVHAVAPGWSCELDEEANLLWGRS
jgi:N-methylhydantoinase A